MYDDLARTQQPTPLEWFVVNAVIPSVVLSLVLWSPDSGTGPLRLDGDPISDERVEVWTRQLPVYPDLLRQAGVQGRVVLEAVVDTTGHVQATSIQVVTATNPGFVAAARQALLATLFRPAMVGGRPIRILVRIPYEFALRNGTGRAR
jgi:TonB family protein